MGKIFIDDPTGTENRSKQEALDLIRFNLVNMLKGGDQFTSVDEIVYNVSLQDINEYMKFLATDKSLPVKLPLIRSYDITEPRLFEELCNYTEVHNFETPNTWNQKIYFIESGDFALTFIPIELPNKKEINIHIEPLEESPDFITELWAELNDEKELDDIDFVDPKDLM
jgi:hypothetical protein